MRFLLDPRHDIDAALLSYRRVFWALALFSGVINLLVLVPSLYMMQVYDRVLTSRNETTLFMLTLMALGLFMFSALIEWVRGEVMIRMSAGLDEALGERIFDAAFARSLREHNANPAQVLTDLATLRQLITGQGLIALLDAPWLPIFLLVAFIFHHWFGVLTLVLALVLIGLALWGELSTRTRLGEANRLGVQSSIYVNSTLHNAEVIQALGMLGPLRQRWSLLQQRIIAAQAHASDRGARITSATRFVRISGQSLALGLGALLVLEGQLSAGMMIAMSLLLGRALAPVEIAIGSWKQFNAGRQSYQRLSQLLAQHPRERLRMPLPPPPARCAWNSCMSVRQVLRSRSCAGSISASPKAMCLRWSGPAPAVNRHWRAPWSGSGRPWAGRCAWTMPRSASGPTTPWVPTLDTCHRTSSCSTARSPTTSPVSVSKTPTRSSLPDVMPVSTK
ncbi:hypothetical protein PHLH4_32300 [Pseudomonas sp. St316]|nr:hypothetical protein PHLH4_32300 [Pseudomonas sp. St316]